MRSILCPSCADKFKEHPDDIADGWKMRKVPIKTKKPERHVIEISSGDTIETMQPLTEITVPIIVCDHCNVELPDGTDAVAVSMWQGGELGNWEKEYCQ